MYNQEESWGSTILGTLFLGSMFYMFERKGRNAAMKELEDSKKDQEINELRRQLHNAKQRR